MSIYISILRGVNVSGKNLIKMNVFGVIVPVIVLTVDGLRQIIDCNPFINEPEI